MQQQALAQEEARGTFAREMQAKLQIKYEPVLTQNMTEMQQNAIHLRHPGCPLTGQTSNGLDDKLY